MSAPHVPQNPSRGGRGGRSRNSSLSRNASESTTNVASQRGGRQHNGRGTTSRSAAAGVTPVTRGSRGRLNNKMGSVAAAGQLRNGVKKPSPLSQEYTGGPEKQSWRDPQAVTAAVYKERMHDLWTSLKKGREQERKDAIRDGFLADPDRPTSLKNAITPVGTCQDMCPEFERVERIVQQMVDGAEKAAAPQGQPRVPCEEYMVKRFRRSAAGYDEQLPSDIRPPEVLERTLDYLIDEVVGKQPLAQVHKFIWDRTRSIRNDFSIQQVTKEKDVKIAIRCFERIARFHIVSLHQLSHPNRDNGEFDHHQEREQLNNTLLSLMYYYDDNRKTVVSRNEAEFRAYCIIFEIQAQRPDLEDRMQSWDLRLLKDPRVETAKQLHDSVINSSDDQGPLRPRTNFSIAQGIFNKFWDLVESSATTYLMGCTAEIYFNYARSFALNSIWKAYKRGRDVRLDDWVIDDVKRFLGFDEEEQTIQFCEEHGFAIGERDEGWYLDVNSVSGRSLIDNNPRRKQLFSKLVERKRKGLTLPGVINGLSFRRARALGMLDIDAPQLTENNDDESLFVSDGSSEEKEGSNNSKWTKQSEKPKERENVLRKSEAANPAVAQTGNFAMNPFANTNAIRAIQTSPSTFGKPSTFVPLQPTTSTFGQPTTVANGVPPKSFFGTPPSASTTENKPPASVFGTSSTSVFGKPSTTPGQLSWHVERHTFPLGPVQAEKPSSTSASGTPSAPPPTGLLSWPAKVTAPDPVISKSEHNSSIPISGSSTSVFGTPASASPVENKTPTPAFATPFTSTSRAPTTASAFESNITTSIFDTVPKSLSGSSSATDSSGSGPFKFVVNPPSATQNANESSTSNDQKPAATIQYKPLTSTSNETTAPPSFTFPFQHTSGSSASKYLNPTGMSSEKTFEKLSSDEAILQPAPPVFKSPSTEPAPLTNLLHQQLSPSAVSQPIFSFPKPNDRQDSIFKPSTTTNDATSLANSSSNTSFKFSLSKPSENVTTSTIPTSQQSPFSKFETNTYSTASPTTFDPSSATPSAPSTFSSQPGFSLGSYSVKKNLPEQATISPTRPDLRPKVIDKLAHDFFVCDEYGVLQQFLEHHLRLIIGESIEQVNMEKDDARVTEARRLLLAQKYFRKWKQIVWKRYLFRNAKERRKNFRQSMQEFARSSLNSSRAGSQIPNFESPAPEPTMPPPEKPASSTFKTQRSPNAISKGKEKEVESPRHTVAAKHTSTLPPTTSSRLGSSFAHRRSHTVEHFGHLSSSGAVSKPQRSYSPASSISSDKSQSLLNEALRTKARRLAPPNLSTDTTRTDYFRLKALGIDPDTPLVPSTRKRRASDQVDMKATKATRLSPPNAYSSRPYSAQTNGGVKEATPQPGGVTITAPVTKTTSPADDDEALFAQVHQLKEALSESISWFREETEKQSLSPTASHSNQTSPNEETEKERRLREFQWTPSRTEVRLRATGGHGLLPKNWGQRNGVDSGSVSRRMSGSDNESETPSRKLKTRPMGSAAINSRTGAKEEMKVAGKGKGKEKEIVCTASGATPDDAIEL